MPYRASQKSERAEWLSLPGAADYLNYHPRTVRKLVSEGKLRAYRASSSPQSDLRFKRSDLDALFVQVPTA